MDNNSEFGEVKVEGVSKTFDEQSVLAKIDLKIATSEILSLLGPSGCGKTTLLRSIAGLENPEEGRITICDQIVLDDDIHVAPEKRKVGMVFQDAALFPHMTVEQNVSYGLKKDVPKKQRVAELLEIVGLPNFEKRRPETLSGGQKQRVALARALAPRPSVLLLDEPFSNLDSALRVEVRAEVHRLIGELGITTIFVTHDQDEAFLLGDRVAVMNDGKIAETPIGFLKLDQDHDGDVELVIRPENLVITSGDDAEIETVEYYGHDSLLTVKLNDGTKLKVRTAPATSHIKGDRVGLEHKDIEVSAFRKNT